MTWQPFSQKPATDCVVLFYHADVEPDLPDEQFSTGYFESCPCCGGIWDWDDGMPEPTLWMAIEPPEVSEATHHIWPGQYSAPGLPSAA